MHTHLTTGYVVVTTITDGDGHETVQHSPIYRTRARAEKIASVTRSPKVWERNIERTVRECRTAFEPYGCDEDVARQVVQSVVGMGLAA